MSNSKKSSSGLPDVDFPVLTAKQLSSRVALEEEAEKMAYAAVRKGWHVSVLSFSSGVKYTSKDLEVDDDYPATATTAAYSIVMAFRYIWITYSTHRSFNLLMTFVQCG